MARNIEATLLRAERSLVVRPERGDMRIVVAFPNRYWVAMSNLGFQTVYALFAKQARSCVERAFVEPQGGPEAVIRTFESRSALSSADILAISVACETDYLNVLQLCASSGRSLHRPRQQREQTRHSGPLILGGGAALTINPEPVAEFFDAILIGEADEAISEIAQICIRARDARQDKLDLLEELSAVEGVYVPSFFQADYGADGALCAFSQKRGRVGRARKRVVKNLDDHPAHTVIETPHTEFKSMFLLETGRGCEMGCRFCVSGYVYRPVRRRSAPALLKTIEQYASEAKELGFIGAAVSRHPGLAELGAWASESGKRFSLSSLMSQCVTPALAAQLVQCGCQMVALAPECGREKLRFSIGKRASDADILAAVEHLAQAGITTLKLYFMLGLPGEVRADALAAAELTKRIHEMLTRAAHPARGRRQFKLILSVNSFVPKPWTPFQRHPFLDIRELRQRFRVLKQELGALSNVALRVESPRASYFQALLSRGDRRVAALLVHLWESSIDPLGLVQSGSRALAGNCPSADSYVYREFGQAAVLPWEIVDFGVKRELLEREYARALKGE